MSGITRALLFVTLLALAAPALAQTSPTPLATQSLDELLTIKVDTVAGAAKREQLVTEAPSSVTVVTAHEIATYGWRTLADVLRSVRGFYVTYDRNYTYLGARGFGRPSDYNNRVLLLVNGHRLNDNVFDATGLGTDFPVDLQLVERIEIIRGPGSALYGTSAFFAVIDVITKRGGGLGGVEASIESASFDTWRTRASFGTSDGRARDLLLSASYLGSGGVPALRFAEYDDPVTGPGLSLGADGDRAGTGYAAARFGGLSIEGTISEREKHLPAGSWDTRLSDPRSRTTDQRAWAGATWRGEWDRATVTARGFYDRMRYEGAYAETEEDVYTEYAAGDWLTGELTLTRDVAAQHRLTGGTEFREHLRQRQSVDDGSGPVDDGRRSRQLGLYLQDEWRLTASLTTVLGVRADYWSLDGWNANPRVGLIYRPDADTSLKLLYGSAFRAPNAYERFYTQGFFLANPLLRPERLRTGEFVAERYVGGRLRITGAAYVTRISRLISQFEDSAGWAWHDNGDDVRAVGAEFEVERRWTSGVVARSSIAVQRATQLGTGMRLSNSPATLGTARLEAPIATRQMTLAADWQYVSARLSTRGTTADAYALTHLTWRWSPARLKGSLAASIYNLFDTVYAQPVGAEFRQDMLWQDGRTVSVRATFGF